MKIIIPSATANNMLKRIKSTSLERYDQWLRKHVFLDGVYDVDKLVNFHEQIDDEFRAKKDYTSILVAIMSVLFAEGKESDVEVYRQLKQEAKNRKITFYEEPSATELERQIEYSYILELAQKTQQLYETEKTLHTSLHLIFLKFITELAPLRTQDFINIGFDDVGKQHYLNLDSGVLSIKHGKSKNSVRDFKIGTELMDIIRDTQETYSTQWLFPQSRDTSKPMSTDAFRKWLYRLFDSNVGIQTLRQICVSFWKDSGMSDKEREIKAQIMGHTLAVSEKNYTKYSNAVHSKDVIIKNLQNENDALKQKIKEMEEKQKAILQMLS